MDDAPAIPVLLVSCYELGHQPAGLAAVAARLGGVGHDVRCLDLGVQGLGEDRGPEPQLIAISVTMHTALRLGSDAALELRERHPEAHICMYGLYAWLNVRQILMGPVDSVIGGEAEGVLEELAGCLARSEPTASEGLTTRQTLGLKGKPEAPVLRRLRFATPDRTGLPPLERYTYLVGPREGQRTTVGQVEATRGCKHVCRHCPVTPVYSGRFFAIPVEVVLADVAQHVEAGAGHISFADPDFLNGPRHAMAVARGLHAAHPRLSFDVTVKISHILQHRSLWSELAELGCIIVVSAVESLSDRVLEALDKGHDRDDVIEAMGVLDRAGIVMRPSLVPFTPWASLEDYLELVDFVYQHQLLNSVDPIQMTIRLLVPPGSALIDGGSDWLGPLHAEDFSHRWTHADPRMDVLHQRVVAVVERGLADERSNAELLHEISAVAHAIADRPCPDQRVAHESFVPHLSEAWFCCAEPSPALRTTIHRAAPSNVPQ